MVKCTKCTKPITKKTPGLQCGKCNKWYHASCVPITAEQLNTLCDTEAVEWKCKMCSAQFKQKRLSAILPDPEDDDNTDTEQRINRRTNEEFLSELRNDIRNAIKEETQRTLKFYAEKIDDFQKKIVDYEDKMKVIRNQHKNLQNKYSNIQLRYQSLEQKFNSIEQCQLENKIEICGVPKEEKENILEITRKVAQKIKVDLEDVISMYRKERRAQAAQQRTSTSIIVTLRPGRRDSWLAAAKSTTITGSDISGSCASADDSAVRVFLREALTPATAYLLWKAKTELKKDDMYKYVWCKGGNVLVRKNDMAKIQTVRSEHDIQKLRQVNG